MINRPLPLLAILLTAIILGGLSLPTPSGATVNIESMRKKKEEKGFQSTLSFTLGYTSGNTDVMNLKTAFRTDYFSNDYNAFLAASIQRGEKDNSRYQNKGFAHLRGMRPASKRTTIEGFVQHEFNDFTLLQSRRLIGAGGRFTLIDNTSSDKIKKLFVGIGAMREWEDINTTPEEKIETTRSTNYISGRYELDDRIRMSGTVYYQPRFSEGSDYRLLFDGGLSFDITKSGAFLIKINYRYDSEPPLGVKDYDFEITNGLTLSF